MEKGHWRIYRIDSAKLSTWFFSGWACRNTRQQEIGVEEEKDEEEVGNFQIIHFIPTGKC